MQRFYANPSTEFTWPNGAIGYGPGGSFDCLGHYARVVNCPIAGTALRLTCYATGYADTMFSVPACTRHKGRYIGGYFASTPDVLESLSIEFRPLDKFKDRLPIKAA